MDRLSGFRPASWPWLIVLLCVVVAAGCQDGSGPSFVTAPDEKPAPEGKKPQPPPPPPPADPAIVFNGLYVMNADGSNVTSIFPDGANPCWSPDGDAIAFEYGSVIEGTKGIYRIEISVVGGVPTGTNARRLVSGFIKYPAWSRDGTKIAFIDCDLWTLEVIPADGGDREVLYTFSGSVGYPAWSRDGTQIAIADATRIGILDLATHQITTVLDATPLGGGPACLDWARTQDALVFHAGDDTSVYTMQLPDGPPTFVVGGSRRNRAAMPTWSPDDSEIVFSRDWRKLQKINVATREVTDLMSGGRSSGKFADWRLF
jgi:Tol biopolymer transport system component